MSDILRSFSDREQQLYEYAFSLQGTMEDKERLLRESGTFAAYRQLHTDYLAALRTAAQCFVKLELLKRLVFINWYYMTEPSCFTGIDDLDEEIIFAGYTILDEYLRHDKFDAELRWMLSYYSGWDYAILTFISDKLPALTAFVQGNDQSAWPMPYHQLPKRTMSHRGQMGRYWQSVGVEAP